MSITVPYHLAIAVLIAVSIVLLLVHKRTYFYNHQKKVLWRYLLLLFSLYILIVGKNIFDDLYYQWDLSHYDLDRNGLFNGVEITAAQQKAMTKLVNDTSRNFSFITGFIFSVFFVVLLYLICFSLKSLKRLYHYFFSNYRLKNHSS